MFLLNIFLKYYALSFFKFIYWEREEKIHNWGRKIDRIPGGLHTISPDPKSINIEPDVGIEHVNFEVMT